MWAAVFAVGMLIVLVGSNEARFSLPRRVAMGFVGTVAMLLGSWAALNLGMAVDHLQFVQRSNMSVSIDIEEIGIPRPRRGRLPKAPACRREFC